jgi:hypothetical protein
MPAVRRESYSGVGGPAGGVGVPSGVGLGGASGVGATAGGSATGCGASSTGAGTGCGGAPSAGLDGRRQRGARRSGTATVRWERRIVRRPVAGLGSTPAGSGVAAAAGWSPTSVRFATPLAGRGSRRWRRSRRAVRRCGSDGPGATPARRAAAAGSASLTVCSCSGSTVAVDPLQPSIGDASAPIASTPPTSPIATRPANRISRAASRCPSGSSEDLGFVFVKDAAFSPPIFRHIRVIPQGICLEVDGCSTHSGRGSEISGPPDRVDPFPPARPCPRATTRVEACRR